MAHPHSESADDRRPEAERKDAPAPPIEDDKPGRQERPLHEDRHADRHEDRHEDELLDEALDETFPASDPVAPSRIDGPA